MRAHAVELAKSKYGHYLVVKMINVAPKDDVPGEWGFGGGGCGLGA